MIQMILFFVFVFLVVFFSIKNFIMLNEKDRSTLLKLLAYSAVCAIIATFCIVTFVVLF